MKKITGNEPINHPHRYRMGDEYEGLTIRQYYAGMMLQAIVSSPETLVAINEKLTNHTIHEIAVRYADLLIAELNRSEPE